MHINKKLEMRQLVLFQPVYRTTGTNLFAKIFTQILIICILTSYTMAAKLFISKKILINSELQPAAVLVEHGKIKEVILGEDHEKYKSDPNVKIHDVGDYILMPGIIDSHVHVNEPGRTAWEGYETATKAAAAGGITTIVDMPLNSNPPTTTLENFKIKQNATADKLHVDVAFWGGVVPGNDDELLKMVEAGVIGFKCFMGPSGIDEFPHVEKDDIEKALKVLEGSNAVLAFHAEIDENVDVSKDDPRVYNTYLESRPQVMEENAIKLVTDLCSKYTTRCHIVHVSAAKALPYIEAAKQKGVNITAETCHHYLNLVSEEIPTGHTEYKCAPPIRETKNREELWTGIKSGILDMVVSDHSPCTPNLKFIGIDSPDAGNFMKAWGGIASLQFGLSLFWGASKNRGYTVADINKLMTLNSAKLIGLDNRKGQIKEGFDADFVVWDPNASYVLEESMIFHKNKVTPYLGKTLHGKVIQTIVRGETVFENGEHTKPTGIMLKK